ncbi:MAG TPA: twin-arginine translocation pathway signal [Cytophagales bacterium]|nr:twin-arginine translocation pathway signal [Cytophagales bacterium]
MKRRDFLKNTALSTGGIWMVPSFLKGIEWSRADVLPAPRRLVIIQLSGGNDGLNTIIPYRNDAYYRARPKLGITREDALALTDEVGLHPALENLRALYDQGQLSVVNGVGYPNPNRSHFRSLDIWHTASDSDQYLSTGWLGRYLDSHCEQPYSVIETSDQLSLAVKGSQMKGLAVQEPKRLFATARDEFFSALAQEAEPHLLDEHHQGYLYKTMVELYSSAEYLKEQLPDGHNAVDYPQNPLARQLKNVAQFISAGLQTRVYYTAIGGFDTHVRQPEVHQRQLKNYDGAVGAFVQDLQKQGLMEDTLILTFSEFGRRVKQNASRGTDHGTANPLWVIGSKLHQPGLVNAYPSLTDLDGNGDLKHLIDFRQVYASVLEQWLQADSVALLGEKFAPLKLV